MWQGGWGCVAGVCVCGRGVCMAGGHVWHREGMVGETATAAEIFLLECILVYLSYLYYINIKGLINLF